MRNADWLKDVLVYILVGAITNACPTEAIQTDRMLNPFPEKLWYYEQYYQKTKQLLQVQLIEC